MKEYSRTATVDELVTYVLERETASSTLDREDVAVALYRTHLPILEDAGLVRYDRERDRVTARGRLDRCIPHLELAGRETRTRRRSATLTRARTS